MSDSHIGAAEIADAVQYAIPHIVIRARIQQNDKKILYPLAGKLVRVEEYARYLLQHAGWFIYKGDDAHLFFSVLSCNFKDSFFRDVCRNWVGPSAEKQIERLDAAASKSISEGILDPQLIDEAEQILLKYYSSYPPKRTIHKNLAQHTRSIEHSLLLKLLSFYRNAGYTTKGAPDLFATNNGSFRFVEVKSHTDSLSSAQYDFFEGYLTSVSNNIFVLRIVPENSKAQD